MSSSSPQPRLIPARRGTAIILHPHQTLKIINTSGHQVIDFFAFAPRRSTSTSPHDAPVFPHATSTSMAQYTTASNHAAAVPEYLSMSHTRSSLLKVTPEVGDVLRSQKRRPMVAFVADTSPGAHDTLVAPCDRWRYEELGVEGWHGSCTDNCWDALEGLADELGRKHDEVSQELAQGIAELRAGLGGRVPDSWNLFMNIPVVGGANGRISMGRPNCKEGDYVCLKAERLLVCVMSCCPQDVTDINGGQPKDAHFEVLE